jgi:hypothetical protein
MEDEQRLLQEIFDSHFQPPDEHNTGKMPRRTFVVSSIHLGNL